MQVFGSDGGLYFDADIDTSSLDTKINHIEQQLKRLAQDSAQITQTANSQASAIQDLGNKAAAALAGYASLRTAENFIGQVVKVRSEFESLNISLQTLLGNKEKADKLMSEFVDLASKTPASLRDIATGGKQLLAYGIATEKVTETLKTLSDVSAGTGVSLNDLSYIYGTLNVQGRAYTRDILQFTQRGIPIIDELSKVLGVSKDKVQSLVEAGKVGFPEVEKAFQNLTNAGGKFYDLSAKLSTSISGQYSNLLDAFDRLLNDIGTANEGLITDSIAGLKTLVDNYQSVLDILKGLVIVYGSYKAAVIANATYNAIAAEAAAGYTLAQQLQYRTTLLAEGATKLLNRTMLANPYVAVATALAAVVSAIYFLSKNAQQATIDYSGFNEELGKERDHLTEIVETAKLAAQGTDQRKEAIVRINKEYGNYLPNLINENASNQDLIKSYNLLNDAIEKNIGLKYADKAKETLTKSSSEKKDAAYNDLLQSIPQPALRAQAAADLEKISKQILDNQKNFDEYGHIANERARQSIKDFNSKYKLSGFFGNNYDGALVDYINASFQEANGLKQIDDFKKGYLDAKGGVQAAKQAQKTIADYLKDFTDPQGTISAVDAAIKLIGNKSDAEDIKKAVTEKFEAFMPTDKDKFKSDYQKRFEELQKIINAYSLDTTKSSKAQEALESKVNSILNERQGILEKLAGLQRDSSQSGLLKDESEVDKVREKYDGFFQAITDYNNKIDAFNKKNGTHVQGIGIADIDKAKAAEAVEVANTIYKQDSEKYISALNSKKQAFEDYEKLQEQGNNNVTDYAATVYKEQLKGFQTYLDYLKNEAGNIKFQITLEPNNVGLRNSLNVVSKAIVDQETQQQAELSKQRIADYSTAFNAAKTYNDKKRQLDLDYNKEVLALSSNANDKDLSAHLAAAKQSHDDAIDAAKDEAFQKTDIYQKLNENIIELSRKQVKQEIEAVKTILANGVDIPDDLKKQLQEKLKDLQGRLNFSSRSNYIKDLQDEKKTIDAALKTGMLSTDEYKKQEEHLKNINAELDKEKNSNEKFAKKLQDISSGVLEISGSISDLSQSIAPFNEGLSASLETLGDITKTLGDAAGAAASFASGDIVGGITKTIATISDVFSIAAKSRESERKANEELKKHQDDLLKSGITYNELLRERARDQQNLNDLTTQELETRQQLLTVQKQQAQQDYQALLNQIKLKGLQVTSEYTEKYGGLLGIGKKTRVVQQTAGVSDADYDGLEKLYTEGALTDSTKAWFEQLKAVHDEIEGITDATKETQEQLNEIYTGTTADAIADGIEQGFEKGYSTVNDFGDNLNDILKKAILSAFEADQIKPAIQSLYDDIANRNSDGVLDASDISQIQANYDATLAVLTEKMNAIKAAAGTLFSDTSSAGSQNSLVGATSQASEQTAQLLAGQIGGLRLTAVDIFNVVSQQLQQQIRIANNTDYLPVMKDILQQMNTMGIKLR